ncbi:hypothetical protein [Modestobacter sp. SSW1-42]|uniref:hypothetical protein n=1 Tax=Modestobacter sp. SSW1-42 TaxID=596372 RepID=UPI0039877A4B
MSTPVDLLPRPSSGRTPSAEQEVGLDALLEFFADEAPVSARRTLRRSGAQLRGWARSSSRRAAAWGAVAPPAAGGSTAVLPVAVEPAAVVVPRSTSVATEAGQ